MKKAAMRLDFNQDSVTVFDSEIPLKTTATGLYYIPITRSTQLLDKVISKNEPITLAVITTKSNTEIATKLHRCFAHPSADKIIKLISNAGPKWSNNHELKKEIVSVSENCQICKLYKKPPPRPVVSLPMTTEFQDIVAMDLKQFEGNWILHLIDLCTRLSAACFIRNKSKEKITAAIFRIWIAVYGTPKKFMSDNGGEFANSDFIEMCEQLNVIPLTTAAESPWSNGVVERNNQTLANMMQKLTADNNCKPELALCWALNAKNSLQNVAGFTPFQLAIGCNPTLPSTLHDDLPALSTRPTSKIIEENLRAIHNARRAFIESENNEKIRRSLLHNVRTSGEIKYVTGDCVYYKRNDSSEWHGPGKVIGQIGQQVFVKHGAFYIRVHPCRLQLVDQNQPTKTENNSVQESSSDKQTDQADNTTNNEEEDEEESLPRNRNETHPTNDHDNHNSPDSDSPSITDDEGATNNEGSNTPQANPNNNQIPSSTTRVSTSTSRLNSMRRHTQIMYKDNEEDSWIVATTNSRAGKSTGKNAHWWNVTHEDGDEKSINLSQKIWKRCDQTTNDSSIPAATLPLLQQNDEILPEHILLTRNNDEEAAAKQTELQEWKSREVYNEIEDSGQPCISLRWVLKQKTENGQIKTKARLCARGFEEDHEFRTDSPTCSREGLRIGLSLIAARKWSIQSIDVKTAFLQGKDLERTVYVRPPKEAHTDKIWHLRKCVYGLSDASRYWYLKVREELIKLGATPSKLDHGIFYFHKASSLVGLIVLFVDDILYAGISEFQQTIDCFKKVFLMGSENHNTFNYVGMHLKQNNDMSITVDQQSYTDGLSTTTLTRDQINNPHQLLNEKEKTLVRSSTGQLNWLANISRPEISYKV